MEDNNNRPDIRLVCLSDTHQMQIKPSTFPEANIAIHTGDICRGGTVKEVRKAVANLLEPLCDKYEYVLFCPGNHDRILEQNPSSHSWLFKSLYDKGNFYYLNMDMVTLYGYSFFGNPYTPVFFNWSFMIEDQTQEMERVWSIIPDVDVLLSHGPPHLILDEAPDFDSGTLKNTGSVCHRNYVDASDNLKLNTFGHIHESFGDTRINEKLFVNSALMSRRPRSPYLIELTNERAYVVVPDEE